MSNAIGPTRRVLVPAAGWRATRAARWMLPFAGLFLLTGTAAHAASQALGQAWPAQSALNASVPAEAGVHWILLSSADDRSQPRSMTCLMPVDRVAADALDVRSVDFDATASRLCLAARPTD